MIKQIFLENWLGKVISLLIALSIWYLIHSNLERPAPSFPVPGTGENSQQPVTPPLLEDRLLTPLSPPVPGSEPVPEQQ